MSNATKNTHPAKLSPDRISFPVPPEAIAEAPEDIRALAAEAASVTDTSCSDTARVWRLDFENRPSMFAKSSLAGTLSREAEMYELFHSLGLSPAVVAHVPVHGLSEWIVTEAAPGRPATDAGLLAAPKRLAKLLGRFLAGLHAVGAPTGRGKETREPAESGMSTCTAYDLRNRLENISHGYGSAVREVSAMPGADAGPLRRDLLVGTAFESASGADIRAVAARTAASLGDDVVVHGDYCLPNVIVDKDVLSCQLIDVGGAGMGDRHLDLYWGAWSLWRNTDTYEHAGEFFGAYAEASGAIIDLDAIAGMACIEAVLAI